MTSPEPAEPAEQAEPWLARARVADEVFALCPGYTALLITADGLRPGPSDPASNALLIAAQDRAATALAGRPPQELAQVSQWREAYRAFGAKPQRTRPSVEALLRRLDTGIPRVDRITDAYNAVSVGWLVPVGGEDRAACAGPPSLVRATGAEDFDTTASGDPVLEHPDPGEVVWRDDKGVTCRRWNWRQGRRTQLREDTATALFILDALGPMTTEALYATADDLVAQLTRLGPDIRAARRLITPGTSAADD
jgi:DNA/RNA-binding domain of Phe-tRNA-synthetase-like protein